jgi:predicted DNA-binding protein (UPF0251 family)
MKFRSQIAAPCKKKADSKKKNSFTCECLSSCKKLQGFLNQTSKGTIKHQKEHNTKFSGCLSLEQYLIDNVLLRYESKEMTGLEVLFEGIEAAQNINAELLQDDDALLSTLKNFLTDSYDESILDQKRIEQKGNVLDFMPSDLGFVHNRSNDFMAFAPVDLEESFFRTSYLSGAFDSDELTKVVATFLYSGIDDLYNIQKINPQITEKILKEALTKIWTIVYKKMPPWAKKFNWIWDRLTPAQAEALKLEWFYDGEKLTQEENAAKLGISIAAYQERLEWAYKKLEKLYPEFMKVKRKNKISKKDKKIYPLFEILPNGEKIILSHPKKRNKNLSQTELFAIKKWAYEQTTRYLYTDDYYLEIDEISEEKEKIKRELEDEDRMFEGKSFLFDEGLEIY